MTNREKLEELSDILEMEEGELTEETILDDIETWDSLAVLSFISIMNDKFNKFPNATEIRTYRTVGDLMDAMC